MSDSCCNVLHSTDMSLPLTMSLGTLSAATTVRRSLCVQNKEGFVTLSKTRPTKMLRVASAWGKKAKHWGIDTLYIDWVEVSTWIIQRDTYVLAVCSVRSCHHHVVYTVGALNEWQWQNRKSSCRDCIEFYWALSDLALSTANQYTNVLTMKYLLLCQSKFIVNWSLQE